MESNLGMLNKKTKCPTIAKNHDGRFRRIPYICTSRRELVETVRDPNDPTRFVFLRWQNGIATMVPSIEHAGTLYVPPDPMQALHSQIILPDGVRPCHEPAALIADIVETLAKFIEADRELLVLLASVVVCTWFPDCFEAAPKCCILKSFFRVVSVRVASRLP